VAATAVGLPSPVQVPDIQVYVGHLAEICATPVRKIAICVPGLKWRCGIHTNMEILA
jgi:hypothetical protein